MSLIVNRFFAVQSWFHKSPEALNFETSED